MHGLLADTLLEKIGVARLASAGEVIARIVLSRRSGSRLVVALTHEKAEKTILVHVRRNRRCREGMCDYPSHTSMLASVVRFGAK
jgi:hypothetical protein